MNTSFKRRVTVASCWASSRITVLDGLERYEDSYAITQEFREWITCIEENPEHLAESVLMAPQTFLNQSTEQISDMDEMLEI